MLKRRTFILSSASVIGASALSGPGNAQSRPCPPPTLKEQAAAGGVTNACEPSRAPPWFMNQAERTWVEVAGGAGYGDAWQSGSRIITVVPTGNYGGSGVSDVVNAWTGGCVSQALRELYLPCNGGHAAWAGNEIYALSLASDTPAWSRVWGPSALADIRSDDIGNNPAVVKNADNTPRTIHGWFAQHCDNNNRIWLAWAPGYCEPAGRVGSTVWSISRTNLGAGWMHHGRIYPESDAVQGSAFLHQASPSAFDPVENTIWQTPEGDVRTNAQPIRRIDCNAAVAAGRQPDSGPKVPGSSAHGSGYGTQFAGAWSVVLSNKSPRTWLINGSDGLRLYNVEAPGSGFISVGASGSNPGNGGRNAFYVPAHSAVYVFGTASGGTVHKLTISGSNPATASYAWSTLSNASGSAVPRSQDSGHYQGDWGKAQGILDMGDGRAALVVAPNLAGPTYVYKLPMA